MWVLINPWCSSDAYTILRQPINSDVFDVNSKIQPPPPADFFEFCALSHSPDFFFPAVYFPFLFLITPPGWPRTLTCTHRGTPYSAIFTATWAFSSSIFPHKPFLNFYFNHVLPCTFCCSYRFCRCFRSYTKVRCVYLMSPLRCWWLLGH